jgi:hypothetical protein
MEERLTEIESQLQDLVQIVEKMDETGTSEDRTALLVKENDVWRRRCDALKTQLDFRKDEQVNLERKWDEMRAHYESLNAKLTSLAEELAAMKHTKSGPLVKEGWGREEGEGEPEKEDPPPNPGLGGGRYEKLEWEYTKKKNQKYPRPVADPAPVDAMVIGISNRVNLMVINVGEEDGVRAGYKFTIYRNNRFIGRMTVETVYPRQAAGRIVLPETVARVLQGDRVTTRLNLPAIQGSPVPDGRLTRVDMKEGYADIDLGTADGVRKGMQFAIYRPREAGAHRETGRIRVIRADKDSSLCSILMAPEVENPPAKGDFVWNKFHVPGRKLAFVLLGRYDGHAKYTREDLKRAIESAGHTVADAVGPKTFCVILGPEAEKDPGVERAKSFRLMMEGPADLLKWLGEGE